MHIFKDFKGLIFFLKILLLFKPMAKQMHNHKVNQSEK